MTSEGLGEMFEGDSADMCAGKFPLVSMVGRAEGLACVDPRARTPIGARGNLCTTNSWDVFHVCQVIKDKCCVNKVVIGYYFHISQ